MRGWVEGPDRSRSKPYRARTRLDNGESGPSLRFMLKREADAWLGDQLAAQRAGNWVDSRRGKMLFREWYDQFKLTQVHLAASTTYNRGLAAEKWILPTFGQRPLGEITQPEVQAWVSSLTAALKAGSVAQVYFPLQRAMAAAVDGELIARTPCRNINLPSIDQDEPRFLTLSELRALADAMVPRYRATVLLAGTAGLRVGEMAGLRRQQVNVFTGQVTVTEQLRTLLGVAELSGLKTKASRRTIPLPRFALEVVKHHIKTYPAGPLDAVFASMTGDWLRPARWRFTYFDKAVEKAGLGDGVTPHTLRHTAVSLWIAKGANPKQVQTWAGHSSIRITYDRYGHLFPDHGDDVMAKLDGDYPLKPAAGGNVVQLRP